MYSLTLTSMERRFSRFRKFQLENGVTESLSSVHYCVVKRCDDRLRCLIDDLLTAVRQIDEVLAADRIIADVLATAC